MLIDKILPESNEDRKARIKSHKQSVFKSITWRVLGTLDTITISYFLTGTLKIAAAIGGIEIFTKMILYYFHERAWILFTRKRNHQATT